MVRISDAENADLEGILKLQQANFKTSLTFEEIQKEGFVTVRHSYILLRKMNTPYPHTIAKDGELVVGYALTMIPKFQEDVPELDAMFEHLKDLESYVVMGQICIHKSYRSQGIFRSMYRHMQTKFHNHVDFIVTEVALENQRSLNAHYAVGFKTYKSREDWAILFLETASK